MSAHTHSPCTACASCACFCCVCFTLFFLHNVITVTNVSSHAHTHTHTHSRTRTHTYTHTQSLHYMRKLCSHPAFVLDVGLEEHRKVATEVLGRNVVSNPKVRLLKKLEVPYVHVLTTPPGKIFTLQKIQHPPLDYFYFTVTFSNQPLSKE